VTAARFPGSSQGIRRHRVPKPLLTTVCFTGSGSNIALSLVCSGTTHAISRDAMNLKGYWFKSSKFEIEPGEDANINSGIYGKHLAIWLKGRLEQCGYPVEDIINEDWGRCLMCQRDPFMLWVGCGNMSDHTAAKPGDAPPKEAVTWHCFATAEVPFLKRIFGKMDTGPAVSKLNGVLGEILRSDPLIRLIDEP